MARRHRCDSAPIGLGHFPVGSNRSGLMVLGARRCRGLHHEALEDLILRSNGSRATRGLGLVSELGLFRPLAAAELGPFIPQHRTCGDSGQVRKPAQQRTHGDGSILILSNLFRGTSDLNPEA
jgi:hypothetical protein